jgi:hypothetical protein
MSTALPGFRSHAFAQALIAPLALALVVPLAGCPTPPTTTTLGPLATNGKLCYVVSQDAQTTAVVLDPAARQGQPLTFALQTLPRAFVAIPTGFLVTGGKGDSPHLDIVTLPRGTVQSISVPGAYDSAAVTFDGAFAVLFFDPTATPAPGSPAARNNNQITVVDLKTQTPTTLSLNTASLAPKFVVFSPDNQLAAIVLDGTVALLNLAQPTAQVQVPLTLPDGTTLHPTKALFSPDGAFVYLQAQGTDDVIVLTVNRGSGTLTTTVNFLLPPGATGLQDIAVPSGAGFTQFVAAVYTGSPGSAALLDATGDTSQTHLLPTTSGGAQFFDLGNGTLLITTAGANSFTVWEPLLDRYATEQLPAETAGTPIITHNRAFFVQPAVVTTGGATAALTSVSVSDNGSQVVARQNPIVLAGAPSATALDPVSGMIFLGIPVPETTDTTIIDGAVVAIDPTTLAIGGFSIPTKPIAGIGVVGNFAFAVHPSTTGDLSFFPIGTSIASSSVVEQAGFY